MYVLCQAEKNSSDARFGGARSAHGWVLQNRDLWLPTDYLSLPWVYLAHQSHFRIISPGWVVALPWQPAHLRSSYFTGSTTLST